MLTFSTLTGFQLPSHCCQCKAKHTTALKSVKIIVDNSVVNLCPKTFETYFQCKKHLCKIRNLQTEFFPLLKF